jgi:cytochrome oxidase assembly protein ShyY1
VYGFLATRRWIGFGLLMTLLAGVMVCLGCWQLARYHQRAAVNAQIDAASSAPPVPLEQALPAGGPVPAGSAWRHVKVGGEYDPAHQILARDRAVDGNVGFEVLTPLVLDDGTAVLVDRGWLPAARSALFTPAVIPPAPSGRVSLSGRLHLPESRPDTPRRVGGVTQVRRIAPAHLAGTLPYRLLDGYVLLDGGQPGSDRAFVAIPPDHQNALMNAGYVVQWWAFALLTLLGFGWAARREARGPDEDLLALDDESAATVSSG